LSYCVSYNPDNENCLGLIKVFVCLCNCDGFPCAEHCHKDYFAVIKRGTSTLCFTTGDELVITPEEHMYPVRHIYSFSITEEFDLVPVENLETLCFYIQVNNKTFVAKPVNAVENE